MKSSLVRCILSVMLMISATLASAAPQSSILVFGDSLSAGYGVPQDTGWVSLLQQRLLEKKYDYRVVNASISSETSAGGRARLAVALKQYKPKILTLQLGGNDGLRGLPVAEFRSNMDAMIKMAIAAKSQVLLIGIRLPTNYGKGYREKFRTVFEELARSNKIALIPSLLESMETRRELFQQDGIHPTKEAQKILLENVWPRLAPMLRN